MCILKLLKLSTFLHFFIMNYFQKDSVKIYKVNYVYLLNTS